MKDYQPTIGLETHVELRTNSKMFCGCPAYHFGKAPNTQTCPVCLGLPGALPVPNKKAIEWALLLALALNCQVKKYSKFDRKHYFYPDLPKGYQISQYDEPLATYGSLKMSNVKGQMSKVRIRRVHIEEDTGKLQHTALNGQKVSLVDFNRSGVPLVEIVTEPDLSSGGQAKEFAQELQRIIRYLEISDCDMEKGSMRLEANISLRELKTQNSIRSTGSGLMLSKAEASKLKTNLPPYKVEVKNINSFRFLEKAIVYEIERQSRILDSGEIPKQETRGWSEAKNATLSQRYKETAADYRYFPEPDIPPMEFDKSYIKNIKKQIPELPEKLLIRFIEKYLVRRQYAQILVSDKKLARFSEASFKIANLQKLDCNLVAGYLVNQKVDINKLRPDEVIEALIKVRKSRVSDAKELGNWVEDAIAEMPQAVSDYKKGKTNAISALIGRVMKETKGRADASVVKKLLEEKLKN